jgi:hypothetical protein
MVQAMEHTETDSGDEMFSALSSNFQNTANREIR